ncbi:hypothetical protein HMPREF0494_0293 [Limosilactobacillus antri DSM 16041]|uniref:Uncharacterized protein n=2 Tax=Limosilactobacillus antri TaxID=227943 RepID=C8P4P9_9LACO|nr:hypothetical protein HMPREF0494_0293 [Limosilactobacillus antri DSM 16041]KRK57542.1 hypothetical protein FC31_GL001015 [Limosilactobacillus antri DSM 16041]
MGTMLKKIWVYTINHKWSKDILRANLLYLLLVLIYNLFHFRLRPISWHLFNKAFWLMNLCLVIKMFLNAYDKAERQNKKIQ